MNTESAKSGSTKYSLMLKIAIWSVSIITSITGLAISPSIPSIEKQFSNIGKTEADMLISLPTLLIIPFILITGKLASGKRSIWFIRLGCLTFLSCAIAYQIANNFGWLLGISVFLGFGAGLVVPLAAQLPSLVYTGSERQRQMGICSGVSNASQVICTFGAGWLAMINWHYSFLVYGIAIVPLLLSPFIKLNKGAQQSPNINNDTSPKHYDKSGLNRKGLILLMLLYFTVMFFNLQIPLSLPFLLKHNGFDSEIAGSLIAIFFLVQALSAFVINTIIKIFRYKTMFAAVFIICIALWLFPLIKSEWIYYILAACAGITGGIIEPLIWNKTSNLASQKKSLIAFDWIMCSNFFCVWATPYILDFFSIIFHDDLSTFPFYLSGIISLVFSAILLMSSHKTIFGMKDEIAIIQHK